MDFSTPIDLEHLHNICDSDPAFEQELLQIFIEDTQTHLAAVLSRGFTEIDHWMADRG